VADDDRLLELLGRALAPPPAEPPPERVAAFRALIAQGRPEAEETDSAASPGTEESEQDVDVGQLPPIVEGRPARAASRPAASAPTPSPAPPAPPPPAVPELARRRTRRVGWLAAGASVAAAAVVLAVLAVPNLVTDRSRPETSVETARAAVARLRTALALGDPIAVAEADAELVRVAGQLPRDEQRQVRNDTVAAHVEAIEFLRENRPPPSPAPPPGGQVAAPTAPVVPDPAQVPTTTVAPAGDPATSPPPPPDPTPAPPPPARSVTIIVVSPQVDGTFEVVFATAGFTPEPGRKPGTYAIRFSFDNGQSPTTWTKSEPWRFPGEHAVTYRQVCAHVVDAHGAEDPASGGCRSIL
jgi:hypothetical protein